VLHQKSSDDAPTRTKILISTLCDGHNESRMLSRKMNFRVQSRKHFIRNPISQAFAGTIQKLAFHQKLNKQQTR